MSASLGKNRSTPPALKICGLKDPDQALAIADLGVQAIGVIGVPSTPRYLEDEQRRGLFHELEQQHPGVLVAGSNPWAQSPVGDCRRHLTTAFATTRGPWAPRGQV